MRTLLIANRGEIAVRIMRSARELGLRTVAVCSETDVDAVHVHAADTHVVIGPAPATRSYLDVGAVLEAARSSGADAIHPGYGFLSERADFAQAVVDAGLVFVGPSADAIRLMGDKSRARSTAAKAGVPTVPGSDGAVTSLAQAREVAERLGFPLLLKAAAGGGGRGISVVRTAEDLEVSLPRVRAEAAASFGNDEVYVERFVARARHVEVQVLGDGERVVHLGERDCSLQRRRQKVFEEAAAPALPPAVGDDMAQAAMRLASDVGYVGAGTVEFLYDADRGEFYFIEMNTRIQVEHPVTEMVTGLDLVREQLTVAAGQPLSFAQDDVQPRGHAVELRINAEDPERGFLPSPGTLEHLRLPGGPFVRVDAGCAPGGAVSPFYDSLIAKVVVWGDTRETAFARARRAMDEVEVRGVATTAPFLRTVLDLPALVEATHHTTTLEDWMSKRTAGADR